MIDYSVHLVHNWITGRQRMIPIEYIKRRVISIETEILKKVFQLDFNFISIVIFSHFEK